MSRVAQAGALSSAHALTRATASLTVKGPCRPSGASAMIPIRGRTYRTRRPVVRGLRGSTSGIGSGLPRVFPPQGGLLPVLLPQVLDPLLIRCADVGEHGIERRYSPCGDLSHTGLGSGTVHAHLVLRELFADVHAVVPPLHRATETSRPTFEVDALGNLRPLRAHRDGVPASSVTSEVGVDCAAPPGHRDGTNGGTAAGGEGSRAGSGERVLSPNPFPGAGP